MPSAIVGPLYSTSLGAAQANTWTATASQPDGIRPRAPVNGWPVGPDRKSGRHAPPGGARGWGNGWAFGPTRPLGPEGNHPPDCRLFFVQKGRVLEGRTPDPVHMGVASFPGRASNNIPTRSASEGFDAGPRWRFGLVCRPSLALRVGMQPSGKLAAHRPRCAWCPVRPTLRLLPNWQFCG